MNSLPLELLYSEMFGNDYIDFAIKHIDMTKKAWIGNLRNFIESEVMDDIASAVSNEMGVRKIFAYLRQQGKIYKYRKFIEIWKNHEKQRAEQFERILKTNIFNSGLADLDKSYDDEQDVKKMDTSEIKTEGLTKDKLAGNNASSSTAQPQSPRPKTYSMNNKKRGLFLLFSQVDFVSLPSLEGYNKDADDLEKLFKYLDFDVVRYNNKRKADILKIINDKALNYDHSENDCFACAFLTHGRQINNEDVMYGMDDYIYTKDILAPFKGDQCIFLSGKPKFFIFQACRGNKLDNGTDRVAGDDVAGNYTRHPDYNNGELNCIPVEADFLLAYSTIPDYCAWVNDREGSWFIQELVKVFTHDHNTHDVLSMLTSVNGNVAYDYKSNCSANPQKHMKFQMPCFVSQLTKSFHLKSKQPASQ